jgi:hypothetical protein
MGISQRCSNAVIVRIRTEEPDIGAIPYDWEHSCIHGAKEEIDHGTKALGKRVVFTTYVDANLFHDLISGKSVTGTLHWANQTVIDFSQLQSTVETATFGSNMLLPGPPLNRSLISGAPSDTSEYLLPSVMFGDNSCQHRFHAFLQTQQETQCIVYHKVVMYRCKHSTVYSYSGIFNPADILSKHWDAPSVWKILRRSFCGRTRLIRLLGFVRE